MNRKLGVGVLIICFGFSNINLGWGTEVMAIAPIVVQPYEIQELNQQMIDRDRQNRDKEIAIKNLAEDNNKLIQSKTAQQQDQGLAQINQTMLGYRDALLSRDRAHIVANGEKWWTWRYGDLVALTEDADAVTVQQDLESKSGLLTEKFQMLTELKDEMTALNKKLSEGSDQNTANQATIDGFKKVAQEQQDKIQTLVQQLGVMDQKIEHINDILAEKDQQIAQLKDNLAKAQSDAASKDATINLQKNQIAILQSQSKGSSLPFSNKVALSPIIINPPNNQPGVAEEVNSRNALALPPIIVNGSNNQPLAQPQPESSAKDEIITQLQKQLSQAQAQVEMLKSELQNNISTGNNQGAQDGIIKDLQKQLSEKQSQVEILKSELENNIAAANNQGQKDEIIKEQQKQIDALKEEENQIAAKNEIIKTQTDEMANASARLKDQGAAFNSVEMQVATIKDKIQAQALDLKAKDESIRWLNQVLAVTKNKAEYFKLTSQQDQLNMKKVQDEVQKIKDDFAQHFKDYDQFEAAIVGLKGQVNQLSLQLSQKQTQVEQLNAQLQNKISQENLQGQQSVQTQQGLKAQLQEKEDQIGKMKADIKAILQAQANKEIYRRVAAAQLDDRIKLAQQLIGLQQQETVLLAEKNSISAAQNVEFDQRVLSLENKIKGLVDQHQIQILDWQNRLDVLKGQLNQKEQQVNQLSAQLKNKISEEKNQSVLALQIEDLKSQLQDEEDLITTMKKNFQEGLKSKEDADSLKQQLTAQQNRADQLKQQLDIKTSQFDEVNLMLSIYQKKMESRNNAYDEQSQQVLHSQTQQALMVKQIADLNAQLQAKEAQVIKIKNDMYDLQASISAKDKEDQARDLSLSMIQQKTVDQKVSQYQNMINGLQATSVKQAMEITSLRTQLAAATQLLKGTPSSDEINFLRTGFKTATAELKQKDEMLSQIKANAAEYEKEFKEQTKEFQSLKDQLEDAQQEISEKNEDLKYKDLAMTRIKALSKISETDLKAQVRYLMQKLDARDSSLVSQPLRGEKAQTLQAQLKNANLQIRHLKVQLKDLKASTNGDVLEDKLTQALDKIDQQGRDINALVQQLQDCGKSPNLTQDAGQ